MHRKINGWILMIQLSVLQNIKGHILIVLNFNKNVSLSRNFIL